MAPVVVWTGRRGGEYGLDSCHARSQPRDRPTDQHIYQCTLTIQPVGESEELDFITAPLFADEQEPAPFDGFAMPLGEIRANPLVFRAGEFVKPSVSLPAFFELTKGQVHASEMKLQVWF